MGNTQSASNAASTIFTEANINEVATFMTQEDIPTEQKIKKGTEVLRISATAVQETLEVLSKKIMQLQAKRREEGVAILKRIHGFFAEVSTWASGLLGVVTGHLVSLRLALRLLDRDVTEDLIESLSSLLAKESEFQQNMNICSTLIVTGSNLVTDINKYIANVNDDRTSSWTIFGCIFGCVLATLTLLACVAFPPCCILLPSLEVAAVLGLPTIIGAATAAGFASATVAAKCGSTAMNIHKAEESIKQVVHQMESLKVHVAEHTEQLKVVNIQLANAKAKHQIKEALTVAVQFKALSELKSHWRSIIDSTVSLEREVYQLIEVCNAVSVNK
eukprot:TRINITY_DN5721_c0_g1_i1.p1 TRINITY_DN5721_c0_g1~~TRINITY_DN5721_c0_g1_i1.p1  ORF type:complete len:332 (-),score=40.65 TRINITY_DN5721_c0_g1_i1:381-1376(-)